MLNLSYLIFCKERPLERPTIFWRTKLIPKRRSLHVTLFAWWDAPRTLHGTLFAWRDAFFRGKTPKIAEKLRISANFRVFCGKTRLFANFLGKNRVFSQKKGGASAKKIIIYFFPRRASRDALCVEHVKSVKDALYVWRSAGRSLQKLRYGI